MKQNEQIMIEVISDMVSIGENVVSFANPEKHVNNINALSGQSTTCSIIDKQIEYINNATDINTETKNKLVNEEILLKEKILQNELERKEQYNEMLDNHINKTQVFILKLALGIGTGGLSYLPDIYRWSKGLFDNSNELTA